MTNIFNTRSANFTVNCPTIAAVKIAYIAIFGIENDPTVSFRIITDEIKAKKPNTWKRFIRLSEAQAQNGNPDESYFVKAERVKEQAAVERAAALARNAERDLILAKTFKQK